MQIEVDIIHHCVFAYQQVKQTNHSPGKLKSILKFWILSVITHLSVFLSGTLINKPKQTCQVSHNH